MNSKIVSLFTCRNCSAVLFPLMCIHGFTDERNRRRFYHVLLEECCRDSVYWRDHKVFCDNCRKRIGTIDEYDEKTVKFCETRMLKIRLRVRF